MKITKLFQFTVIIVSILLSSFSLVHGAPKKGKKQWQNLLFIITDQQRYDALSIAGNKVLQTPNLDRLAEQGVFFSNAYSACAVCGPARSSILTGCRVETHGVKTNGQTYFYDEKAVMTMPTFDEILAENGYQCEYYGKWHSMSTHTNVYKNPKQKAKNGKSVFGPGGQSHVWADYLDENCPEFKMNPDEFFDSFSKRSYKPDPLDRHYGMQAEAVRKLKFPQCDAHGELMISKEHTLTAYQARETIDAIERLKDKPFSITCSFHFPHAPMIVPEPYYSMYPAKDMVPSFSISDNMENSPYKNANGRLDLPEYSDPEKIKYMISNYYGLVKEIDDWIGEILAVLDKHGLTENTLVVFTSDHGEMLGAHGLREKNVFYEESAHIPLLMRFPGEISENTKVEGYVSHVDLFATVLDYMKIDKHESDGESLRNLIEGKETGHGDYVVTEWDYRGDVSPNYMIVKDGWKLMIPYSKESKVINAMYDLNTDPFEMRNLLGGNPERSKYVAKAEDLRKYLLEWLQKTNSTHYDGVKTRQM